MNKSFIRLTLTLVLLFGLMLLVGTSIAQAQGPKEAPITPVPKSQQVNPLANVKPVVRTPAGRVWPNGGFENGDFTNWTKSTFLNPGLTLPQPFTGASINRNPGGSDQSIIVGNPTAAPRSLTDPTLGSNISLRLPFNGHYAARINGPTTGQVSNEAVMSIVITAQDFRASDGNVHIFLAYAPVLDNPAHLPEQQPFFFVQVRNQTQSKILFEAFSFAGQGGLPWQTFGNWNYMDWQAIEAVVTPADIAVGDTVVVDVVGADCSLGGHAGWVYVDDFGTLAPTQTMVTTSPNPSTYGQAVTFTANVSSLVGGTINSGTVQFYADGVAIGTPQPVVNGVATLPGITTLAVGNRTISAVYSGDADWSGNTSPNHTHVVNQGNSTTTLTSSRNPSTYGEAVTFTCAVSGGGGTPTGTVSLYDGTTLLGSGTLSNGRWTFTTSALAVGSHAMRCEYAGDNNYTAGTGRMTQQVLQPQEVPEADTLLLLGGGMSGLGVWLRYQWSKRRPKK